ncbi:MAG: hypothetical protein LBI74_05145, partial [Synergistaceae bacterium]|nr:hypothetical protein [Synergistaceae bacterium]
SPDSDGIFAGDSITVSTTGNVTASATEAGFAMNADGTISMTNGTTTLNYDGMENSVGPTKPAYNRPDPAVVIVIDGMTALGDQTVDITAPMIGATPQKTTTPGTGYTGTISWSGNPETFAASTVYTATVALTSTAGYQWPVTAPTITAPGQTLATVPTVSDTGSGNTLTFTVTFPATAAALVNLGNQTVDITAPMIGATPQKTTTPGIGYTGTISWSGNPEMFAGSTVYTATVTLTSTAGYQWPVTAPTITAPGQILATVPTVSDTGSGNTLTFTVTFPATAAALVNLGDQTVDITAPMIGATPQKTTTPGTGYTGTISWSGNPETFAGSTVYTATVALTSTAGYQWPVTAPTITAPGQTLAAVPTVSGTGSGNTLTFTVTFPATDTDPGSDDPDTPVIDNGDEDVPAVIVPLNPDNDVKIDPNTGVETITVPTGSITQAIIDAALEVAFEAGGTEPTVEVKIDKPVDATGAPVEVKEVRVGISVSDLKTVAESEVENIKIASDVGEITLNTGAMKDLIASAGSQGTVEVVITREDKTRLEELTQRQRETLSDDERVREVYDISLFANRAKVENFVTQTGKLTIGLPYELRDGEEPENVWVHYVEESGLAVPMEDGRRYDRNRKAAIFETNHLSIFAIVYEADAETQPGEDELSGGSSGVGCDTGFGVLGMAGWVILALFSLKDRAGRASSR